MYLIWFEIDCRNSSHVRPEFFGDIFFPTTPHNRWGKNQSKTASIAVYFNHCNCSAIRTKDLELHAKNIKIIIKKYTGIFFLKELLMLCIIDYPWVTSTIQPETVKCNPVYFCHQNQNAKNIGNFATLLKPHNIGTHLKGIETSFQVVPLFLKSFHFWVSYITFWNLLKIPSVF
jgi:hypothetical protein